jgi:hypothetical protein
MTTVREPLREHVRDTLDAASLLALHRQSITQQGKPH